MVKKLWTTLVCGIFYSRSLGACEKHRRKKSVATFRGHYVPCNVFHSIEKKIGEALLHIGNNMLEAG